MKIYNIGIKLIGIYLITYGIISLPSFILMLNDKSSLMYLMVLVQSLTTFIVGLFLLFKSEKIVSTTYHEQSDGEPDIFSFSSAIQLLGIYFSAISSSKIIDSAIALFASNNIDPNHVFRMTFQYQHFILLLLGVILIAKGKAIASYVRERT